MAALQTPAILIHSFIRYLSNPFPPSTLWRCHAQSVSDRSSSYKIDCVTEVCDILNPQAHEYCIIGSKGRGILLLNGWIFPVCGVVSVKGLHAACVAGLFMSV